MSSIETMGISCVDCEKKRGIGPKMLIFSYCPSKFNLHISYAHSTKTPQISFQNLTQTVRPYICLLYSTELQLFWRILTFLITVPYKYSYLLTDEILVDKYLWQFYGKINIYGSSMEKYVQKYCRRDQLSEYGVQR